MYHHLESTKKPLIGKVINHVNRESEYSISLYFDDGSKLSVSVSGDCCSHSIFYDFLFSPEQVGAVIEDLEEYVSDNNPPEEEVIKKAKSVYDDFYPESNSIWDVVFKTSKGKIVLRHINSSNGYYNGMTSYHYSKS